MAGFLSRLGRGLTAAAPYAGQVAEGFDPAVQRRKQMMDALAEMNLKKGEQELAMGEREVAETDRMKGLGALAKSDIGRILSANPAGFDKTAPATEISPEEFSSRFQGERAKVEPLASSRLMSETTASGSFESPIAREAIKTLSDQEATAGKSKLIGLETQKTQVEIEKLKAESDKLRNQMESELPKEKVDTAITLHKQFVNQAGEFIKVRDAYSRIKATTPTAAGDIALIFNYMKMLDPGSTVREGEFATAQNAAGVPDRILNQYNKAMKGERLAPDQRKDFIGQAENLYGAQKGGYDGLRSQYGALSEQYGIPSKYVLIDLERKESGPVKVGRFEIVE